MDEWKNNNILDTCRADFRGQIVGITGTNGKSSVALLLAEILKTAHQPYFLGGGGFEPFENVNRSPQPIAILELGSALLEPCQTFRPEIAVFTNLAPAHFERHGGVQAYYEAKKKIFRYQTPQDLFIYNAENEELVKFSKEASSQTFPIYFSNPRAYSRQIQNAAYYDRQKLFFMREGKTEEYPIKIQNFRGEHLILNVLAALAVARFLKIDPLVIQSVLDSFQGLPQRLEKCAEKEGRVFYDDSRAKNPLATAWALMSFSKPVILISGGINTRADYRHLKEFISRKVKVLILMGKVRREMHRHLQDLVETYLVEDLADAMKLSKLKSASGDTILFSPATFLDPERYSSFDALSADYRKLIANLFLPN